MDVAEYKKRIGMNVVAKPMAISYVVATGFMDRWEVYAKMIKDSEGETRWVITTGDNPSLSYMFKDDGLFGHTGVKKDLYDNSFGFLDEAINAFHKFYK